MATLWIALGSAIGGVLRFWISKFAARGIEMAFGASGFAFAATTLVNISGSLAIGFFAGREPDAWARQLFMIGVLGGYTTFSSFSLQTLELIHEGRWFHAWANVLGSVFLSLLAVALGHWCARAMRGA